MTIRTRSRASGASRSARTTRARASACTSRPARLAEGVAVEAPTPLRVVRHSSECDRWELVFGAPDPRLHPYVIHYCGYDEETTTFRRRIEAAGLRAPLIFNFGPPIAVRAPRRAGEWQRHADGFVAGLDDTYALVSSTTSPSGDRVPRRIDFKLE